MAKLNKIIYNLYESLKPNATDDSILSERQLEFIVNHFRAKIIAQRYNTNKSLSGFAQELVDLKMERTKDFRVIDNDCVVLKSKDKLPTLVNVHREGFAVHMVGVKNSPVPFQKTNIQTVNCDMYNPFIKNCYFIHDGYLYLFSRNLTYIKEVYLRGYFENPREVLFANKEIDEFTDMDFEYPIPISVLDQINAMVVDGEFRWMNILPKDSINNGEDDQRGR